MLFLGAATHVSLRLYILGVLCVDSAWQHSLPYTEPLEDVREQVLRRAAPSDLFESGLRVLQICQHEFLRQRRCGGGGGPRAAERVVRAFNQRDVTDVGDLRPIATALHIER